MNSENMTSAAMLPVPGLDMLNISGILATSIFGLIGFVAFLRGRKMSDPKLLIIGILLMGYSFFVSNAIWTWVIGIALTAALFIFRDQ